MNKITVIGTFHTEGGVCTSNELIKIIQGISHDVIFCEASPEKFTSMLKATENFNTPEIKAIRNIIANPSIDVIPVDVDDEDPFDQRLEAMNRLFEEKMPEYSGASAIQFNKTFRLGFPFLNSAECDQIFKDKSSMEMFFVQWANNPELSTFYKDWLEWNDKRENHWIKVIDHYVAQNKTQAAIFLVGSAHRIRLMEKIKYFQHNKVLNPTWDFYPF